MLAYLASTASTSAIYLYRFDSGESQLLNGTSGGQWPFLSPDGKWVGFFRKGKLQKIAADGGEAITLCATHGGPGAVWLPDRRIVFSGNWLSGLSVVSEDGGTPSNLTTVDESTGERGHWWPTIGPDGVLFFTIFMNGGGLQDNRIARIDLKTGTRHVLFPGARAYWTASGHLVFYRAGRYVTAAIDPEGNRLTTDPVPVFPTAIELDPEGDWPQRLAVSTSGSVAYVPGKLLPESKVAWISKTGDITPLALPARSYLDMSISPDGRRVALGSLEEGRFRLRIADLERDNDTPLEMPGMSWRGVWHPDNKRLAFNSMRNGDFDVFIKDLSSGEPEVPLLADRTDTMPTSWTPDGGLVFQGSNPDGSYSLKLLDPKDPRKIQQLTGISDASSSVSPDGKWLAFTAGHDTASNVFVQRLLRVGTASPVSRAGDRNPEFSQDGHSLYFIRGTRLIAVSWREADGRFITSDERVVSDALTFNWGDRNGFALAPDGRVLAFIADAPKTPMINVALHWSEQLKSNVPRH